MSDVSKISLLGMDKAQIAALIPDMPKFTASQIYGFLMDGKDFDEMTSLKKEYREYLKEHNPMMFNDLVLDGQLWTYLADLNEQAQERLSLIVEQMKAAEGVTEELKVADQMAWVGAMNSIHNRAEEIVLKEIVYR